jgi:tetratricopeptide (TPR) repeat protein
MERKNLPARLRIGAAAALILLSTALAAQSIASGGSQKPWSLSVEYITSFPLTGKEGLDGSSHGGAFEIRRSLGLSPYTIGFNFNSITHHADIIDSDLTVNDFGASVRRTFSPAPWLRLGLAPEGGVFMATLVEKGEYVEEPISGNGFYIGAQAEICFLIAKRFELSLSGGWRDNIGLHQSASVGLRAGYDFSLAKRNPTERIPTSTTAPAEPAPQKPAPAELKPKVQPLKAPAPAPVKAAPGLKFSQASLDPIFPVLFKYYDEHAVGKVVLRNDYSAPIENVELSYFVAQYMDNPKLCATIERIEPGKEASVDLLALFNEKLLGVSEGTKVSSKLVAEYTLKGAESRQAEESTQTLRIFDRNASMWDDDRKAAAFVTSKDPTVLRFSKNVLAMVREKSSRSINQKLLAAMAFHEATRLYGLTYVVDPTNSYAAILDDKTAVDFLQFPRQTLDYKGGNCSALSILYCALLESVGIETAFITVPGHIFMAVCLDLPPTEARSTFASPDDLVIANGKAWLPIETTARDSGFTAAWQAGAKEWRENLAKGQAALYPIHEAWALYEPVGFASDMAALSLPDKDKVQAAYLEEVTRYIDREIYDKVAKLNAEVRKSQGAPAPVNRLGVLYARYGLADRARLKFEEAAKAPYAPAMINLGHLAYQKGDYKEALVWYGKAEKLEPGKPELVLAIARANHELENYGVVKSAYERLKKMSPELAEQFSYLALKGEEGTRAADASGIKDQIVWSEK